MEVVWYFANFVIVGIFFMNILLNSWYKNRTNPKVGWRIFHSIKGFFISVAIYVALVVVIYLFMSKINFRIETKVALMNELNLTETPFDPTTEKTSKIYQTTSDLLLSLFVPIVMIGSLSFAVFGGAGMSILPITLILGYLNKPTRPNAEDHVLAKNILNQWSKKLIETAQDIYSEKKEMGITKMQPLERKMREKKLNKDGNQLEKDVMELMNVFTVFKMQDNIVDVNPLTYLAKLIIGIFFLLFSLLFVAHTFLSTQGFYIILESIFMTVGKLSTIMSLFVFLLFNLFVGLALVSGSFKMLKLLGGILNVKPMKLQQTWTNTFLTTVNILLTAIIGSIVYFMKYCPNYFRFLNAELQFNKLIIRLSAVDPIYAYNIPEYLYLLFFLIAIFVLCFEKSPKAMMAQKVEEKKVQMEEERERGKKKDDDKDEKKDD